MIVWVVIETQLVANCHLNMSRLTTFFLKSFCSRAIFRSLTSNNCCALEWKQCKISYLHSKCCEWLKTRLNVFQRNPIWPQCNIAANSGSNWHTCYSWAWFLPAGVWLCAGPPANSASGISHCTLCLWHVWYHHRTHPETVGHREAQCWDWHVHRRSQHPWKKVTRSGSTARCMLRTGSRAYMSEWT